jgi:hypothetical protein
MIEGSPFLYQSVDGTVYHVAEEGIQAVELWSSQEEIVAFVDGDKSYDPKEILVDHSVQLIVASSPKGAHAKWIKQIGPGSSVTALVVKLWSDKELFLTGLALLSIAFNTRLMPL